MKKLNRIIRVTLLAVGIINLNLVIAHAATIVVTNAADSGPGTLRQAILDANADASPDVVNIEFNIPGAGVHTIAPLTPLPVITRSVTIDGYTQPGTSPNTLANGNDAVLLVELSGANLGGALSDRGITIVANDCTVRGLVINRFSFHDTGGIWVEGGDNCVVEGNFIGTDASGMAAPSPVNFQAVVLYGSGHRVGGLTPAARNILSGNRYAIYLGNNSEVLGNFIGLGRDGNTVVANEVSAIALNHSSQTRIGGTAPGARNVISGNGTGIFVNVGATNFIQGNFIGTDASGTLARGNTTGIVLNESTKNLVGGIEGGAANVISGNSGQAVYVTGSYASNNVIAGNLIGTDVTGTVVLGNKDYGVLYGGANNLIGGTNASARNVIAGSGVGVANYGGINNAVLGNSMFDNTLGIDLGSFSPADLGPTPNDPGDADDGANHYQNFPEITSVKRTGRNLNVSYGVDSAAANSAYPLTVEFYIADAAGSGRIFLHRTTYITPQALADVSFKPAVLPAAGDQIVATATDANGNTSEFSASAGESDSGHKVTICHAGVTISVDQHAVSAHLAHGDTLGACQ